MHHPPSTYNISEKNKLLLWTVYCLREKHLQPREGEGRDEGRLWQQCENKTLQVHFTSPCPEILLTLCGNPFHYTCIMFKGKVEEE